METKKVFVGSFYEFERAARDETIQEYKEFLPANSKETFIRYDDRNHLFSFDCDRTDTEAVSNFFGRLYAYVSVFEQKTPDEFVDASPKLKPIQGTIIEDNLILDEKFLAGEDLIGIEDDVESNADDTEPSHVNPYWTPSSGSSKMLTRDIAAGLTETVEASLYPEHDRNRVTIMGADAVEALMKLNTLESLMNMLFQQRERGSKRPSANILMLAALADLSILSFKPVDECRLACDRIVVDQRDKAYLDSKCITQLLHRDGRHGLWSVPVNMTPESVEGLVIATEGHSLIWDKYLYPGFGSAISTKPVEVVSTSHQAILAPPQKFVSASQAHEIGKWTENITIGIDPEAIEVEAPVEVVPPTRRLRAVREDSDDETDENENNIAHPMESRRQRKVAPDSDDEVEEINPRPPTPQVVPSTSDKRDDDNISNAAAISTIDQTPDIPAVCQSILPDEEAKNCDATEETSTSPLKHEVIDFRERQQSSSPTFIPTTGQPQAKPNWTSTSLPASKTTDHSQDCFTADDKHVLAPAPSKMAFVADVTNSTEDGGVVEAQPLSSLNEASLSALGSRDRSNVLESFQPTQTQQIHIRTSKSQYPTAETYRSVLQPSPKDAFDPSRHQNFAHRRIHSSRDVACSRDIPFHSREITQNVPGPRQTPQSLTFAALGGRSEQSNFPTKGSAYRRERSQSYQRSTDLIQVNDNVSSSENMKPPPGFDFQINTDASPISVSQDFNLLDGPLDNIQHPSIKPATAAPANTLDPASASSKSSLLSTRNGGVNYVNTYNPPINMPKIEEDQLAMLKRMQAEKKEQARLLEEQAKTGVVRTPKKSKSNTSHRNTQRKQKDEEASTRRMHDTMGQKAPKPKKSGKQTTKKLNDKERQQKLNQVLGETPNAVPMTSSSATSNPVDVQNMSTRKQQILKKNPELDPVAAVKLAQKQLSSKQTANLIEHLSPIFEASRAFRGDLKFEIQFGQVLVANSRDSFTGEAEHISVKKWESMFGSVPGQQIPAGTNFTNILTRNGHDVDRILKARYYPADEASKSIKLFSELEPRPTEIFYEFHCQSKESVEFWIIVDQNGNHHIRKGMLTVGTVNLHYPSNIWDAQAIVRGTSNFCELDEDIVRVVSSFMETVYVPAQESLSITYRQPAKNDMTVRSVTVKRTSFHNCYKMDCQDIQLQVTEVKALFHRFHQKDRQLTQSFEKDFQEMYDNDRIHYEVSLVNKGINEVFKQNQELELGSLTKQAATGKNLLRMQSIQLMLDLVTFVISKIDSVGVHNNGTLHRMAAEQQALHARKTATIMPGRGPLTTIPGMSSAFGGKGIQSPVPGLRMNQIAEVIYDEDGTPVRLGQGGARIPVIEELADEANISSREVDPGDSASNAGGDFHRTGRSIQTTARMRGVGPREPGFW